MKQAAMAFFGFAASFLLAQDLPPNTWVTVDDDPSGGCSAGLVYLPEQKGMLLYGRRDGRGVTNYWAEVFQLNERKWAAWVPEAGRLSAQNERGSSYTQWKTQNGYEMPVLPHYNNCFWSSHQMCLLPGQKKVLYFWGGATFTYDPARRTFENLKIGLAAAPPDVMLGSMAWDPVNQEAILFGGGYLKAYTAGGRSEVKQEKQPDAWTPERWDRRGTWAYSPAKNAWRKLETASKDVAAANARLLAAETELRALWGATRGIAFEHGDLVSGKKPDELAAMVDTFAAALSGCARDLAGNGADVYEQWQFTTARALIEKEITARLREAAAALRSADGWKALRALDASERKLVEAQETLAVAPRPRHYARLVTVPDSKVMVLFGGDGEDRFFADTWLLHLDTHQWERCRVNAHPPEVGSGMVAMDYDAKNKVVVLAHPAGAVWTFDVPRREWKKLGVDGEFARKGKGGTWMSLEYAPDLDQHVLIDTPAGTMNPNCLSRRTQMLRLDLASARRVEAPAGTPEEAWRRQYGQGSEGPANKYDLAWSFLPQTQEEYRQKVAAHQKTLASMPANTWTQLKAPYTGWGRAYGSFCYDWDRDEILLWGGGHSAYMGNEVSQYDLNGNLWMESWNPEFPCHPHGSPDGPGWTPQFQHAVGSAHGYYNYSYSGSLRKTVFWGSILYDPDRMRFTAEPLKLLVESPGQAGGLRVEMNGAAVTFSVSAQHWYGGPFGVWQVDPKAMTNTRLKGSDTPFGANDRAKATFDTKRKRILFYGATNSKEKGGKCNALWAYGVESGKWEKIEPAGDAGPAVEAWNYCYAAKYDGLLIPARDATWFYDSDKNLMKKLDCKPVTTAAGVIYSPRQDLFYMLDGDGYRPQQVWVFRYQP